MSKGDGYNLGFSQINLHAFLLFQLLITNFRKGPND